jgi:hypothetical protein
MVMRKVEPPAGMRPAIHALLKPRWDLQSEPPKFVAGHRELVPDEHLPPGTQIDYMVPRLRKVSKESLSPEEKKLARWVQIVLPPGAQTEQYLAELKSWPCFDEVHMAPRPSLPSAGMIPRPK